MELGRTVSRTASVLFENEGRTSEREQVIDLVEASVAARERYPIAEDAVARVPEDVAYFRLRRMESDEEYITGFAAWIQENRGARGAIIDIRDNGGGSRLPLLTLLPHVLGVDEAPVVVNAGRLKLGPGCPGPGCEVPQRGYLADRFMLPIRAIPEGTSQRTVLDAWLPGFAPEWQPPDEGFSDWHYLIVDPDPDPALADKPVVILMNNGNFSASDIFLSGLKGRARVTLLGTPSSGGSARQNEHVLPGSNLTIRLASLASFQARDGRLYDGVGIQPDVYMEAEPSFFVNESDLILEHAIELIRASPAGS
jgi:C-terminal processing protease CtpA/Prc